MADLDLLAPTAKHAEALQIVRAFGYEAALPEASPGLDELLNHAACLQKSTTPFTTLELHSTLVAEKSFTHSVPVDWFWRQTEPLKRMSGDISYPPLLMLTPTAQVLYACAHAMLQHGGRNVSLRWLYDLDRLIRVHAGHIDWNLILSQARLFAWSSACSAALSQAVEFFATPVPENILDELSRYPDRNTKRVAALQNQPATHTLEEYQKLQALNWLGKLRLIVALTLPGPAYMRWRYGLKTCRALPLWYLYRWCGIVTDGIRTTRLLIEKASSKVNHFESRSKPLSEQDQTS
jgi:hypothetical protein